MRYLTSEILRCLQDEKKMAFIAGPRQVGKTTLAKHLLSLAGQSERYFNWDIESHRRAILRKPEQFWTEFGPTTGQSAARPRIVLDEIHKYPRWKRFLKGLYDSVGSETEILVTGSGRLDIYQRGGDSLFGRYGLYHLHPFTLGELLASNRPSVKEPKKFWDEALHETPPAGAEEGISRLERFTGFPEPLFAAQDNRLRKWRRSRQHLVLREDLRDLTHIRELGLIEAMVTLLPGKISAPLSINSLARDVGVAFNTVRLWIEALSKLYYLFAVRPYAGKLTRTLRSEAKIYLFDYSEIEDPGARFENLVALHLQKLCDAWNDWGYGDYKLHYVRDKEKREVDFLITQSSRPYLLLEAKVSDQTPAPALRYYQERFKPAYCVQLVRQPLSGGIRKHGRIFLISAGQFLSRI